MRQRRAEEQAAKSGAEDVGDTAQDSGGAIEDSLLKRRSAA
jgi:hypothetical protein